MHSCKTQAVWGGGEIGGKGGMHLCRNTTCVGGRGGGREGCTHAETQDVEDGVGNHARKDARGDEVIGRV